MMQWPPLQAVRAMQAEAQGNEWGHRPTVRKSGWVEGYGDSWMWRDFDGPIFSFNFFMKKKSDGSLFIFSLFFSCT
jgi:hypothetical protein